MEPTVPNTRDFEIMLKIVPIDGIGLSCVDWHRITALCVFLLQIT
jgi:hypothetical protein